MWVFSMSEHWIPIYFKSEDVSARFEEAIDACQWVHAYTVETMNEYFISHAEPYPFTNFRIELAVILQREKEQLHAQRYSLVRAAEKTFPYWNENKKIKRKKFVPVEPIPKEKYSDIWIETRQVWKKYLALYQMITTAYGSVYLDESWTEIVREQLAEKKSVFTALPFLAHSVTIRRGEIWQIRFNLHNPKSVYGKIAKKEMQKEFGR